MHVGGQNALTLQLLLLFQLHNWFGRFGWQVKILFLDFTRTHRLRVQLFDLYDGRRKHHDRLLLYNCRLLHQDFRLLNLWLFPNGRWLRLIYRLVEATLSAVIPPAQFIQVPLVGNQPALLHNSAFRLRNSCSLVLLGFFVAGLLRFWRLVGHWRHAGQREARCGVCLSEGLRLAEVEDSGALCVRGEVAPLEVGVERIDPQLLLVVLVREEPVVTLVGPQIKAVDPFVVRLFALQ